MGNRLVKFLSEVLPTHDHFYVDSKQNPQLAKLRIQTQNNLLKVRKQLEDVAFAFDKEIYKMEMEKQGLEFDPSPTRLIKGRRVRRRKIVTFAIEDDEHHDCEYRYAQQLLQQQQQQLQQQDTKELEHQEQKSSNLTEEEGEDRGGQSVTLPPKSPSKKKYQQRIQNVSSPISSLSDPKFDLSLWEDRDPGMEIVDMSISSEDSATETDEQPFFEDSSLSLESPPRRQHLPQASQQLSRNETLIPMSLSNDFEANLFNPDDEDGWESVKESSDSSFDWPELEGFVKEHGEPKLKVVVDHSNNGCNENTSASTQKAVIEANLEHDCEEGNDEISYNSSDFECNDTLDISLEEDVSFVEKIALENINCSINELRDGGDEDSDAADSWEQNNAAGDDVDILDNKEDSQCHVMDQSLGSGISMTTCDTTSSMQSNNTDSVQNSFNSPDEHLVALHQEFMSSFEADEEKDEEDFAQDSEDNSDSGKCHDKDSNMKRDAPRKVIHEIEYPDELPSCDSNGADKTVVTSSTAETEAMSADLDSDQSNASDCCSDQDDAVIGISRRESYYPSIDSPQRHGDGTILSRRIDIVQDRIEEHRDKAASTQVRRTETNQLQEQTEEQDNIAQGGQVETLSHTLDRTKHPNQMAQKSVHEYGVQEIRLQKDESKSNLVSSTGTCRLKKLRQTKAWQRRYR